MESFLDSLKWDKNGLVAAIAQNVDTGAILMQGFANRDAISATIASRRATFFSRSRSQLWTKGETSNNFIHVQDISVDCDRDSVCLALLLHFLHKLLILIVDNLRFSLCLNSDAQLLRKYSVYNL